MCFWGMEKIMIIDIIGELVIDVVFGLSMVAIYKKEEANCIIKSYAVEVIESEQSIVGKLEKYKSFFIGNFYYDKKNGVLNCPRRFIKNEKIRNNI